MISRNREVAVDMCSFKTINSKCLISWILTENNMIVPGVLGTQRNILSFNAILHSRNVGFSYYYIFFIVQCQAPIMSIASYSKQCLAISKCSARFHFSIQSSIIHEFLVSMATVFLKMSLSLMSWKHSSSDFVKMWFQLKENILHARHS